MSLKIPIHRFIQYSSTLVIGALLISIGCTQTPDSNTGPFNKKSTGEEVTEGLDLSLSIKSLQAKKLLKGLISVAKTLLLPA